MTISYCGILMWLKFWTYLNGHILGAPHEYVLHGLNPELNWGSCCAASWPFFLFVLAHPASWCLLQWHKFHAHPSQRTGQLNTDIQVNNTAMSHLGTHTHISISHSGYYSFSSFHFFHSLGQAGWLRLFPSDTVAYLGEVVAHYREVVAHLGQVVAH